MRDHVISFYNFGQQKGFLLRDGDHAAPGTTIYKEPHKVLPTEEWALATIENIEFYLPNEMRPLLKVAPLNIRPSLELKAFSGVRSEEIIRFWWVFSLEAEKLIKIPKEIAKFKFRMLPILENLQRRQAAYDKDFKPGEVCKDWEDFNSLCHAWLRIFKKASVPSKKNGFRDSYISYRISKQNFARLSEQ